MTDELEHQPGAGGSTTSVGDTRRNPRDLWAVVKASLPRPAITVTETRSATSHSQSPIASFVGILDQLKGAEYFSSQGSNPSTNSTYKAGGNIKHGNFTKNILAPICQ
jgi:hypothetical protein